MILGGRTYEALASDIGSSYAGKVSAIVAVVIVLATATIGLLVFGLLTRRLKRLSQEMRRVSDSGFELSPSFDTLTRDGDEIDGLARSFADMSTRRSTYLIPTARFSDMQCQRRLFFASR